MEVDVSFFMAHQKPEGEIDPVQWDLLSEAFRHEKHLIFQTSDQLQESYRKGLSIVGLDAEGNILAHTKLAHLWRSWYELGSTFVYPQHRKTGLMKAMYAVFFAAQEGKFILATTTNTFVFVHTSEFFYLIERSRLPARVLEPTCCCPSAKIGAASFEGCIFARGEKQHDPVRGTCWVRVTHSTARALGWTT